MAYINAEDVGYTPDNYELTTYKGLTFDYKNDISGYEGFVAPWSK